jgi:putative ABC transport system permease protein
MDFGDVKRPMKIVGFINVIGIPLGYAPIDYVTRLSGTAGLASIAMIGTGNSTIDQQQTIARNLEEHYQDIGIGVTQTNTLAAILGTISGQIDFLIFVILAMAGLLGAVGGLGLASTMSLNVLERTREIGVMRSIGASNGSVRSIFLVEGLLIGIISCVLASLLSVPISYILGSALGNVFFQQPLELVLKPSSFIIWLIIALVIASFASLLPANRAAQISVRESISYE